MRTQPQVSRPIAAAVSVLVACALFAAPTPARAQAASTAQAAAPQKPEPPPLHRPRDRFYDVVNYRLEIEADLKTKTVSGDAEITLVPIRTPFDILHLDAWKGIQVSRVTVEGSKAEFTRPGDTLEVPLDRPYGERDTITVSVRYSVTAPPKGLYFSGPDSSDPAKPWQLYSQGEMEENHYWFPCYDFPNDRATSEMIATVASPFTAISNGRFVGKQKDASGSKVTWHWKEEIPHVSYLVSLVVGEYTLVEDRWRDTPIMNYVYAKDTGNAARSFSKTPAMMDFFTELTAHPYPWEKYGHAVVQDFIFAGQENVSISTLTDNTIHDARAHLDENSDGLVAHELAHQWFGDLLSFRDWSEAWLSEGFATYLTLLSEGNLKGKEEYSYQLSQTQADVSASDRGDRRRPTVTKRYKEPGSLFDNRIYGKGGCVLHMLRKTVGDTLFFRAFRKYVAENAFKTVETTQLRLTMEEISGRNLDWFFDQWVYGAGFPEFDVSQAWSEATRTVSVTVRQTQKLDSLTGLFRTPVDILVWVGDDPETFTEEITDSVHVFTYPAYREPKLVIFDKGSNILKTATFRKPAAQWVWQLHHADDAADRIAAVHELRWTVDSAASKEALMEALLRDRFWGVRYEAALALGDAKTPIGAELSAGYGDIDARVRGAAVRALGNFRGEAVTKTLRHAFAADSSYVVAANAVRALVKADSAGSLDVCLEALGRDSRNDAVRVAGLRGAAGYTSAPGIADTLKSYAAPGRRNSLRALAVSLLAKGWRDEETIEYTEGMLNDPATQVRRAAADALGAAGNEDALDALRDRLGAEKNERVAQAIRDAIKKIEDANQ